MPSTSAILPGRRDRLRGRDRRGEGPFSVLLRGNYALVGTLFGKRNRLAVVDSGSIKDEVVEGMPSRFNTQSTLTVQITSGSNVHDFELKSE